MNLTFLYDVKMFGILSSKHNQTAVLVLNCCYLLNSLDHFNSILPIIKYFHMELSLSLTIMIL